MRRSKQAENQAEAEHRAFDEREDPPRAGTEVPLTHEPGQGLDAQADVSVRGDECAYAESKEVVVELSPV